MSPRVTQRVDLGNGDVIGRDFEIPAGVPLVRRFPFAFNTPSILTGAPIYTPTVGDILLDAWIEINTAWDGTTPLCDAGLFTHQPLENHPGGWFSDVTGGLPIPMQYEGSAASSGLPQGVLSGPLSMLQAIITGTTQQAALYHVSGAQIALDQNAIAAGICYVPARFVTAAPVKVVVSQDGTPTGSDPGSTHGAAILYLVTATPI